MLFDSAIMIDFLNNVPGAREAVSSAGDRSISIITRIEVLAGARTVEADEAARSLLKIFRVLPLSSAVSEAAISARRERRLKLPDAIIWATARVHGLPLVTRNTKDFPEDDRWVRVPYRI